MYAQIFFVTSVRGNFFAPQIAASSGLRLRGEDALPRLLHGRRIALACGLRSRLAQTTLFGRDLLEGRLRNRRLRRPC